MKGMTAYYVSRGLLCLGFGALLVLGGSAWWIGVLVALVAFGFFFVAPRLGRYAVNPQRGALALERDERAKAINAEAGRNAFVVISLALGAIIIYNGLLSLGDVPIFILQGLLILGVVVYYVSDFMLRKAQS